MVLTLHRYNSSSAPQFRQFFISFFSRYCTIGAKARTQWASYFLAAITFKSFIMNRPRIAL
jgi:hypothetical protein